MRWNIIPAILVAVMLLANAASAQGEPKLIIDITTMDGKPLEAPWTLEGQGLRFNGASSKVIVDDLPDGEYMLVIHLPHLGVAIGTKVEVKGVTRLNKTFPIADATLVFMLDGVEPIRNAAVRLVTEGGKALEATTNELGEAVFEKLLMGPTYKLELRWDGRSYEKEMKIEDVRLVINVPKEEAPPEAQKTITVTATVTAWETRVVRVTETVRVEVTSTLRETATTTVTATATITTTSVVEKEIIPGIPLMIGIIAAAAIAAAAILVAARKRAKEAR